MHIVTVRNMQLIQKLNTLWLIYQAIEKHGHVTFGFLLGLVNRSKRTLANRLDDLEDLKLVEKGVCPTCGTKGVYSANESIRQYVIERFHHPEKGSCISLELPDQEYFELFVLRVMKHEVKLKGYGKRSKYMNMSSEDIWKDSLKRSGYPLPLP